MKGQYLKSIASVWCLLTFMALVAIPGVAQSLPAPTRKRICPLNVKLPGDLTIGSVKVTGRRGVGPLEKKLEAMFKGKLYTPDLHRDAMKQVEDALTNEINASFEKQAGIIGGASHGLSGAAFLRTDPCVEIESTTKSVEMIVRVLFLRLDLRNLASNLLTLPRSVEPSFYDKMPAFLRAFNPVFNLDYDRKTGPVSSLDFSTNLVQLHRLLQGKKVSNSDLRLDLNFSGEKSLSERFYRTKTDLVLSKTRPSRLIEQLDFTAAFGADDQPLNVTRHVNNELRFGGQIKLRPRLGLLNSIFLSGAFDGDKHDVYEVSGHRIVSERNRGGRFRGVIDGRVFDGFARLGVWLEDADARRTNRSYRRLAGLFGYQKEFGSGTQTVGLEGLAGAGKAWGDIPIYASFFGGNNAANFLYDSPNSPAMTDFPAGPLLRSYGKTQAGLRSRAGVVIGGQTYWHVNLNVSIPVRPWSRRLIPDEIVTFENGDVKLNTLLENFTIKTAIGTIGDDLLDGIIEELMRKDPNLSEDEAAIIGAPLAEERAKKIVERDVAPNIRFIARHANLFAVKPLLMLDFAQVGGVAGEKSVRRFAAGGGLQLVVVVARAEMGYMRSMPTINGESRGNFVFRLTFQNLF
ncbi:MAG: hypothetical protein AABN95_12095 [Acidobacteriota bacterium]